MATFSQERGSTWNSVSVLPVAGVFSHSLQLHCHIHEHLFIYMNIHLSFSLLLSLNGNKATEKRKSCVFNKLCRCRSLLHCCQLRHGAGCSSATAQTLFDLSSKRVLTQPAATIGKPKSPPMRYFRSALPIQPKSTKRISAPLKRRYRCQATILLSSQILLTPNHDLD
jgi:hypothetical protein